MVKNTHGGAGHKKFARKHNASGAKSNKLRISEDEGEIYAIVTKMLGNGMFHCHCIDGVVRLCHIRGKFTGRGKRDNMVEGGKWVLVGLREWDVSSVSSTSTKAKIQHCDLLEVYLDIDKERLRETVSENWSVLDSNDVSREVIKDSNGEYNDIIFGSERDFEREKLIEEMKSSTIEKISFKNDEKSKDTDSVVDEEEVNFDDI